MDGNHHCAVFSCSNSRNKPERLVAQFFVLFLSYTFDPLQDTLVD